MTRRELDLVGVVLKSLGVSPEAIREVRKLVLEDAGEREAVDELGRSLGIHAESCRFPEQTCTCGEVDP